MIKKTSYSILFYSILGFCVSWPLYGFNFSVSLFSGSMMMLINLAGLSLVWNFIFSKKSIALVLSVIIFKYLILVMILWILAAATWMRPVGFLVGSASLVLSILTALSIESFSKKRRQ